MSRATRLVATLSLAVALFVSSGVAAFAYWSSIATGTMSVTTAPPPMTTKLYLENPGTGNTTSAAHRNLVTTAPTLGALPNYDTNRDSSPGLVLGKGSGIDESDAVKNQRWSAVGPIVSNAPVKLRLWSAMKGFDTSKVGSVVAGLYQCNDNTNFNGCTSLAITTVTSTGSWSGGSNTWVEKVWDFGTVNLNVPSNRRLYVKVVVNSTSGDDMWFAYDTSSYPSALEIG